MTYGVDQCRVCGVPITVSRPTSMEELEKAKRLPPVPEKEWRRLGFLTVPTHYQWYVSRTDGCCAQCGLKQLHKQFHFGARGMGLAAMIVFLGAVISAVVLYFPH